MNESIRQELRQTFTIKLIELYKKKIIKNLLSNYSDASIEQIINTFQELFNTTPQQPPTSSELSALMIGMMLGRANIT